MKTVGKIKSQGQADDKDYKAKAPACCCHY